VNVTGADFPYALSMSDIDSIQAGTKHSYADIPLVSLDIETDTSGGGGLDPHTSRVVAASLAYSGTDKVEVFDSGSEAETLQSLESILAKRNGLLITWNGAGFDLPFLSRRYQFSDMTTSLRVAPDPTIPVKYPPPPGLGIPVRASWGSLAHVDISYLYAGVAREGNVKWSLKSIAKYLGYSPVEVDRARVHALTPEDLRKYVASDAVVTVELAQLLRPQILVRCIPFMNL